MTVKKLEVIAKGAPNERIIRKLREVLKDAKTGRIQGLGMALACEYNGKDADAGRCTESIIMMSDGWSHSTTAAVSGLFIRLNYERYAEGDEVVDTKLGPEDE